MADYETRIHRIDNVDPTDDQPDTARLLFRKNGRGLWVCVGAIEQDLAGDWIAWIYTEPDENGERDTEIIEIAADRTVALGALWANRHAAPKIDASPKRIQRTRRKGDKMPAGAIYVGRPTRWGNPYNWEYFEIAGHDPTKAKALAVMRFRLWLEGEILGNDQRRREILEHIEELRGHDLACWCKPGDPCHADYLLELANREDA